MPDSDAKLVSSGGQLERLVFTPFSPMSLKKMGNTTGAANKGRYLRPFSGVDRTRNGKNSVYSMGADFSNISEATLGDKSQIIAIVPPVESSHQHP